MSVKTNQYASQISQDTGRGPSNGIWADCPIEDFIQGQGGGVSTPGVLFWEEFLNFPNALATNAETPAGQWLAFLGNNAAVKVGTGADTTNLPLEGGVSGFTAGSNNNLSISMTAGTGAYRIISPASGFPLGGKLWFEARIAVSTVVSGTFDFFVGLMDTGDAGTRITSAADLVFSAANTIKTASGMGGCLGFWKRATTNPSDVAVVYNVNNGTAQLPGTTASLNKLSLNSGVGAVLTALSTTSGVPAANTFIKLGFVFDPSAAIPAKPAVTPATTSAQTVGTIYKPMIQFFVNGQVLPWFLTPSDVQASTFCSSFMAPTIGFRTGASGAGVAYCDWMRVAQLATY